MLEKLFNTFLRIVFVCLILTIIGTWVYGVYDIVDESVKNGQNKFDLTWYIIISIGGLLLIYVIKDNIYKQGTINNEIIISEAKESSLYLFQGLVKIAILGAVGGGFYFIGDSLFNSRSNNNNTSYTYSDGSSTDEYSNTNDEEEEIINIGDLSCSELVELVQDEGNRIQYLDDSDMNSDALNNVSLYEYDGIYYVVISFQGGNHEYVYCDIDLSYWNRFANNDEDSYGRGYQNWIRPNTSCDCGR